MSEFLIISYSTLFVSLSLSLLCVSASELASIRGTVGEFLVLVIWLSVIAVASGTVWFRPFWFFNQYKPIAALSDLQILLSVWSVVLFLSSLSLPDPAAGLPFLSGAFGCGFLRWSRLDSFGHWRWKEFVFEEQFLLLFARCVIVWLRERGGVRRVCGWTMICLSCCVCWFRIASEFCVICYSVSVARQCAQQIFVPSSFLCFFFLNHCFEQIYF